MARASRSNKKHPDFDPSELEDLIFSPAVGKGVGSHLVTQIPATDAFLDLSTVPRKRPTHLTAVDRSDPVEPVIPPSAEVASVPLPETAPAQPRRNLWITEHGDVISAARV